MRRADDARLSRAAREALEEHLNRERMRVLSEARRLGEGESLSAFEIVNAVEALKARDHASARHDYSPGRSMFRSTRMLILFLVTLAVATSALAVIVSLPVTPTGSSAEQLLPVVVGILTATLAVIAVTVAMIGVMRVNIWRRRFDAQYAYALDAASRNLYERAVPIPAERHSRREDKSAGAFISKWISFEKQLRDMGSREIGIASADARRFPIGELLRMLRADINMSPERQEQILQVLDLRNRILHSGEFSSDEVEKGMESLEELNRVLESRAGSR